MQRVDKVMSEWIRTQDKKPSYGVPVIAYCRIYGRFIAIYDRINDSDYGEWIRGEERGILPPTHWAYLAKIPDDNSRFIKL